MCPQMSFEYTDLKTFVFSTLFTFFKKFYLTFIEIYLAYNVVLYDLYMSTAVVMAQEHGGCDSQEELPHIQGQGWRLRGATPRPR